MMGIKNLAFSGSACTSASLEPLTSLRHWCSRRTGSYQFAYRYWKIYDEDEIKIAVEKLSKSRD